MDEIQKDTKKNEAITLLQKFWHVLTILATATVFCISLYNQIESNFREDATQGREIEELKKTVQELKAENKLFEQKLQIIEKLDDEIRHELNSLNHQNIQK
ncbi:MAG: hypothetical protein MUC49_02390 [Raineya sp.]|jgi:cell division protein FtsB|nr:hypothetical protein [Raineya sp.]